MKRPRLIIGSNPIFSVFRICPKSSTTNKNQQKPSNHLSIFLESKQ